MPTEPSATRDVFLNLPFDKHYENLYIALIVGTTALGLKPRSVLEIETTSDRLNRLLTVISDCPYSIHDLSRVQMDSKAPKCPRFNMPFELGLTLARTGKIDSKHHWIVLEEQPFRIQKSLSDLNGYEVHIHHGKVTGLLQVLRDVFDSSSISTADMKTGYRALRFSADALKEENGWDDLYRPAAFRQLVLLARQISAKLQLK